MADKYFTLIKDSIIRSNKLDAYEKVVLNVLLSYGDCAEIYPTQETIAQQANISRDKVNKVIKSLKQKKYLKTVDKKGRSSLLYKLNERLVVAENDNTVVSNDTCGSSQRQRVVAENDTSNKSISNKNEKYCICSKRMVLRKSNGKEFWGCSDFPKCRNTESYFVTEDKTPAEVNEKRALEERISKLPPYIEVGDTVLCREDFDALYRNSDAAGKPKLKKDVKESRNSRKKITELTSSIGG